MRIYVTFYFILIAISLNLLTSTCRGKNDKNKSTSSSSSSQLDPIDSIYIENFLAKNPEFKTQRNKIIKFYSRRNYSLAWSENGKLVPQAGMFINMINNIENEGLPATKLDFSKLKVLYSTVALEKKKDKEIDETKKNLDLMLTASYFNYAKYIWRGTIDPKDEDIEWHVQRKKIKYGKTLDAILEDKNHPFIKNEPLNPAYGQLKKNLSVYREIEKNGGWPAIQFNGKLQKNDTSATIVQVKNILSIVGDLKTKNPNNLFDAALEQGLKHFQKRHGLKEDGILAGETIKELNVPVSKRIEQIMINMERWRWVPQNFSDTFLMVNIPEYKLRVYEKNKEVWNMNVIVGKAAHSTPIFNDELEFVVFSPYWNVPKSIVINELLPLLRKNPVIIEKENMEIYEVKPENVIDPYSIDWTAVTEENVKYQFRQKPGPKNSLGKVKFLFPNEFDVYLHDTPGHELFNQTQRGFSHGCIRLEQPQKLAEYLLKNETGWNSNRIEQEMNDTEETYVKLSKKIPVYILYFTSWVDEKGDINFRQDIYSHDESLARSLFEK